MTDLTRVEHAIAILGSLVWTAVVLLVLVFVWGFQDAQAQWDVLRRSTRLATLDVQQPSDGGTARVVPTAADPAASTPSGDAPRQVMFAPPGVSPSPSTTPTRTPSPTDTPTRFPSPTPVIREPTRSRPTTTSTPVPTPTATPAPPVPTSTPAPQEIPPPTSDAASVDSGPDRLVIASLGIDTPVVPVTWATVQDGGQTYDMWQVADYAAGWHVTSALPGQPGNTVIAGHHNIKGEVFRILADIQEGAEVDLYMGDTVFRYYVEQTMIVKEKGEPLAVRQQNARWIGPTDDVRLTLITCWPHTNNTHRVIVVAKPRS